MGTGSGSCPENVEAAGGAFRRINIPAVQDISAAMTTPEATPTAADPATPRRADLWPGFQRLDDASGALRAPPCKGRNWTFSATTTAAPQDMAALQQQQLTAAIGVEGPLLQVVGGQRLPFHKLRRATFNHGDRGPPAASAAWGNNPSQQQMNLSSMPGSFSPLGPRRAFPIERSNGMMATVGEHALNYGAVLNNYPLPAPSPPSPVVALARAIGTAQAALKDHPHH